jgi:predicted nucleotidyltransferase
MKDNIMKVSEISSIILFGSVAEGQNTEQSDIDLVIISNLTVKQLSNTKSYREFLNKLYEFDISQEYDILYFKSLEEIQSKKESVPICEEIINKGKVIYKRK